ncbi:MAG TPA: lysophospholipid acyltransferase family protein, partial [Candidatus Omnitrophota bacterium]|nr:lysophospholipid acyltransferase family protein [Candidatus Omnitrophota bacterium]
MVSNHQSHLDPPLVGCGCRRQMNFLARNTLFRSPLFAKLISSVNAIPIDREGGGLAGLKETLRRLKRGEMVLVFPEGTRTPD